MLVAMTLAARGNWRTRFPPCTSRSRAHGDAVDDVDVLGNLGNASLQLGDDDAQRHFYGLELVPCEGVGCADGGDLRAAAAVLGHLVAGDSAAVRSSAVEALSSPRASAACARDPLAWLTLLAALQGRDDFDRLLADLDEVVAACPLDMLADPVHDLARSAKGANPAAAGDTFGALRRLYPGTSAVAAWPLPNASTPPSPAKPSWPRLGRRLAEFAKRPADLGAGHRRLRARDDRPGAPADADHALRLTPSTPRDGPAPLITMPAPTSRTASGYAATNAGWRPASTCGRPSRRSTTCAPNPSVGRATPELRASGETARKRDPSTLVKLTPMELKIAQLVSSGLSNKEVAAQCWVSPRTVAFHLRNVFAKAGITSARRARPTGERLKNATCKVKQASPSRPHPGHLTGVTNPDRDHARTNDTPTRERSI